MNRAAELQSFADAAAARASSNADPMAKVEEEVQVDAKFEEKKGGVRLCSWLRYGSLQAERPSDEGISAHMRKHWDCPQCREHFVLSGPEIDEHKRLCSGRSLQEISKEEIAALPAPTVPTSMQLLFLSLSLSPSRVIVCSILMMLLSQALHHLRLLLLLPCVAPIGAMCAKRPSSLRRPKLCATSIADHSFYKNRLSCTLARNISSKSHL